MKITPEQTIRRTMSEGGLLAWKIQTVKKPRNGVQSTCNFSDLNHPLPDPPNDQMWTKEGRDWILVPVVAGEAVSTAAVAESHTEVEMVKSDSLEIAKAVAVSTAVPISTCESKVIAKDEVVEDSLPVDGMIYHDLQETDTFQGLCLRYKVTPTELRRANRMLGTNLKLAPKKLMIPLNKKNATLKGNTSLRMTKEEQIAKLVCEVRKRGQAQNSGEGLAYSEARCYLEMNDWNLEKAIENAVEDLWHIY